MCLNMSLVGVNPRSTFIRDSLFSPTARSFSSLPLSHIDGEIQLKRRDDTSTSGIVGFEHLYNKCAREGGQPSICFPDGTIPGAGQFTVLYQPINSSQVSFKCDYR